MALVTCSDGGEEKNMNILLELFITFYQHLRWTGSRPNLIAKLAGGCEDESFGLGIGSLTRAATFNQGVDKRNSERQRLTTSGHGLQKQYQSWQLTKTCQMTNVTNALRSQYINLKSCISRFVGLFSVWNEGLKKNFKNPSIFTTHDDDLQGEEGQITGTPTYSPGGRLNFIF